MIIQKLNLLVKISVCITIKTLSWLILLHEGTQHNSISL